MLPRKRFVKCLDLTPVCIRIPAHLAELRSAHWILRLHQRTGASEISIGVPHLFTFIYRTYRVNAVYGMPNMRRTELLENVPLDDARDTEFRD